MAALTQWISVSRPREGQARLGQRCLTSPSGLTISTPQSGQWDGIFQGLVPARCSPAGPTTWGMTSPARCTITRSPSRMSLRLMSSSLWSVAFETVTPPTCTGSSCGPGVERARAAHPDVDPLERRDRRRRRPLERARPAWTLVKSPEATLLVERVDLDHDPVDLVVELLATVLPLVAATCDLRRPTRGAPRRDSSGSRARAARRAAPTASRARALLARLFRTPRRRVADLP